ncbi:RING/U-box superfamily protein [Striga hermonthica]|uniref:E3 ubiquitin-protein ligase RMA n=1 Tax=Striga hermonthica TaxID=68872 RepID=A0A9N7N9L6_STRHE|nr:RING/U-box superfamily protein [Striga hermonthica]
MDCDEMCPSLNDTYSLADNTPFDTGCFECHICFELAHEPIVTLCGHLYCWPCLYQWLHLHSHSHECPVCKAIVQEENLVPIFGRGKSSRDPRPTSYPGVTIPSRPMGQRPQTAPRMDRNSFALSNDMDPISGLMPMAAVQFGHTTLSTIFSALPTIFNLHQVNGAFHDANFYGSSSGAPYVFSSTFHGGFKLNITSFSSSSPTWVHELIDSEGTNWNKELVISTFSKQEILPHLGSFEPLRAGGENIAAPEAVHRPLLRRRSCPVSSATVDSSEFDAKVFRHNLTRSKNYNRKGFGHKKETLEQMSQEYTSMSS